jgi:hypothetical protein
MMVKKKKNELEPRMRLGGHDMGLAPVLLDDAMNAMRKVIEDYAGKCDPKPAWWTKVGGRSPHQAKRLRYFRPTQHPPARPRPVCIEF